jgi:NitT/TauT family transport system substrate-binding protein
MRRLYAVLLAVILLMTASLSALAQDDAPVRVAGLIGPTGMSLAPMIAKNDAAYAFTLAAAPEELVGDIVASWFDIAAVPTNLAAVLYNKTKGAVRMLAVNTLGVLYILEKGDSVQTVGDLQGKTITTAGQGAVPEYALNYILEANGLQADVVYKSEHNEVSALAASGLADLVMLPQPMVTALMMKDDSFRVALDLTAEFSAAAALKGQQDTVLSMGCMVVRKEFADAHPDRLAAFLAEYAEAIAYVNDEPAKAAVDIAAAGILPNEKIAEQAIPMCNIVYITGEAMKDGIAPLMDILYQANPNAVGGAVPDDGFYYIVPEEAVP